MEIYPNFNEPSSQPRLYANEGNTCHITKEPLKNGKHELICQNLDNHHCIL